MYQANGYGDERAGGDSFWERVKRYIGPRVWLLLSYILFSFVLILVQETVPQEKGVSLRTALIVDICLVALVIEVVMLYKQGKEDEQKALLAEREQQNRWAKRVLSGVSRLPDYKTDCFRSRSKDMTVERAAWPFFYDIDEYLKRSCESMRDAVAGLMECEPDYVEVSFVYSVRPDGHWHWAAGRSSASGAVDMDEFVQDPDTLFNSILEKRVKSPFFCNQKAKCEFYRPGRRDRLYGSKGSLYAAKLTFARGGEDLVEGVLLISTYGVHFSNPKLGGAGERAFERNLAMEVLPYYLSTMQAEMGALHIRHRWESARVLVDPLSLAVVDGGADGK